MIINILRHQIFFLFILFSYLSYSQNFEISLLEKNQYETKNLLGQNGFDLIYETSNKIIFIFEKRVEFSDDGPVVIRYMVGTCNDRVYMVFKDYIFLSYDREKAKNYFYSKKVSISEFINSPKPKSRKDLVNWKPHSSFDSYNVLTEETLIRESTSWFDLNDLNISIEDTKQLGYYHGFKDGAELNIVREIYTRKSLKDNCNEIIRKMSFFSNYKVELLNPDDLLPYLYIYIDDLRSLGVFDHLNINSTENKDFLKIFTNNINMFFEDIRDFENAPDYNSIAIARSMNNNCRLDIQVDYSNWNDATYIKRLWIMYHELTHDLFNVEHGHGGPMMDSKLPLILTEEIFLQSRMTLINYLKLIKFKETCSQKGEEKLNDFFKNEKR